MSPAIIVLLFAYVMAKMFVVYALLRRGRMLPAWLGFYPTPHKDPD